MVGIKSKYTEKFADGKIFHFREFGLDPENGLKQYQIYTKSLEHIAMCEQQEMAEIITELLNKNTNE